MSDSLVRTEKCFNDTLWVKQKTKMSPVCHLISSYLKPILHLMLSIYLPKHSEEF